MLTYDNPMAAANSVSDYIIANYNDFPEYIKPKALEAAREGSPVVRLVKGMEVLYAVARLDEDINQEDCLNTLGATAMQIAESGFWGKQDRALTIIKYVRHGLGEWPEALPAPAVPDIEAEYLEPVSAPSTTIPPTPTQPVPTQPAPAQPTE